MADPAGRPEACWHMGRPRGREREGQGRMGRHSYAPGCAGKSGGGGAVRESRVDPVGSTLNGNGAAASPAFPLPLPGESIGEEKAKVKERVLQVVGQFPVARLSGLTQIVGLGTTDLKIGNRQIASTQHCPRNPNPKDREEKVCIDPRRAAPPWKVLLFRGFCQTG